MNDVRTEMSGGETGMKGGNMRAFQIANWVLTILGVVLLTFSLTRDGETRWLWFALTIAALFGAVLTEYLRHRAYRAAQQASVAGRAGG